MKKNLIFIVVSIFLFLSCFLPVAAAEMPAGGVILQTDSGEVIVGDMVLPDEQNQARLITVRQENDGKVYRYYAKLFDDAVAPVEIKSAGSLFLAENKLMLKDLATNQTWEIKKKPGDLARELNETFFNVTIREIVLVLENDQPVYNLVLIRPVKLLFFIPIKAEIKMKVKADESDFLGVMAIKKPWWSFLASGLSGFIM